MDICLVRFPVEREAGYGDFGGSEPADIEELSLQKRLSELCSVCDEPPEESNQRHADSNHFEYWSRVPRVPLDLAHHVKPVCG